MTSEETTETPQISTDQGLLVEANWMLREGHRTAAVPIAVKACEVVVARAIRKQLAARSLENLFACLRESMGGFDLRHSHVCQLYEGVTGHSLRQEAQDVGLWTRFVQALSQQERILFDGGEISDEEARETIDAATRFVEMVARANGL